jgi:fumarate hydratase subunit beta
MSKKISITTPLSNEDIEPLRAGDEVSLSGIIYTGRDAAHKRMIEALEKGQELAFPIKGQVIYYVGPSPAPPGRVIGSAGPTTSGRMDAYAIRLIEMGLKGMIGKGNRSRQVIEACMKHKCVYFGAIGGAGALIAKSILEAEVVAWEDLGPEAVRRLKVKDLPLTVINDIYGRDLYQEGRNKYSQT